MWHAFQPIVSLQSGAAVGFEALARFPGRGPQAVLAEVTAAGDDALRRFDAESVSCAAEAARGWLPRGARLFVNLTSSTLAAAVAGQCLPDAGGLPVVWELPENGATAAVLAQPGALATLARRFPVALDDVGEGRHDLGRLAAAVRDGVAWVKVARSFVHGCAQDGGKRAVLRAVAGFGVPVVAEGAERQEDLAAVAAAGIGFVQGFAVGRPERRPVTQLTPTRDHALSPHP